MHRFFLVWHLNFPHGAECLVAGWFLSLFELCTPSALPKPTENKVFALPTSSQWSPLFCGRTLWTTFQHIQNKQISYHTIMHFRWKTNIEKKKSLSFNLILKTLYLKLTLKVYFYSISRCTTFPVNVSEVVVYSSKNCLLSGFSLWICLLTVITWQL